MNKTAIIAFAVRLLSEKSKFIAKPDPFSEAITTMFGGESYDMRYARVIEQDLDRATESVRRAIDNHKFKKITKDI